ncbi:MAG: hypothetical protein ACI89U_001876 [Gammaproteobacteria bacterium]|jgi:hypothetical protein
MTLSSQQNNVTIDDIGNSGFVIYVGAQKNMGPAGLAIMIVRKDPLGKASSHGPAMVGAKSLPKTTLCPILPYFWVLSCWIGVWLVKKPRWFGRNGNS